MKDYYTQIDKALKSYEDCKLYHTLSIDWICDRITWCYKWKKISEQQMHELTGRACEILEYNIKH